ncbi:MAG: alpha-E domain-containing protein, partial [Acidimicrobiales bacterium]
MLSRIAEALYWMGRYMERAEDTARILDVHVHHTLEDAYVDSVRACRAVLQVMGVAAPEATLDAASVSRVLAFDRAQASSITSVLIAARENARGVREVISAELWEALNATYNALDAQVSSARNLGTHAFFRWVKERAAVVSGLADSTMSRDDGWRFLVLGRSVERVDMTARLLSVRFADPGSSPEWVTTLRCCSAHEAYLRTYHRAVDASL